MQGSVKLRAKQEAVLQYEKGKMGIAAVPGSGKTTTLSVLASHLIQNTLPHEARVLIVTYQNAGVDNIKARVRNLLKQQRLLAAGYDVRTLHSLSHNIIMENPGLVGVSRSFEVLDQRMKDRILDRSVQIWEELNQGQRNAFLPDKSSFWLNQWRRIIRRISRQVITTAKQYRLTPGQLIDRLVTRPEAEASGLLAIGADIYQLYQKQIKTLGALDYDDLVRLSVDLLEEYPEVTQRLRERWPFVLEDEAQDSVPLQEELLERITGPRGNWIRVGDPNQAIMSTFTASDPQYLNAFLKRGDVNVYELDEAGRSSERIIGLANELVRWVCTEHPLAEVREHTFRPQYIVPTPPGDPQPNPPDTQSKIEFKGYASRRQEYDDIVRLAKKYCDHYTDMTVGVLVPTNDTGYKLARSLHRHGARVEEMLSNNATARGVAEVIIGVLECITDPVSSRKLGLLYRKLVDMDLPDLRSMQTERISRILEKHPVETVLYPTPERDPRDIYAQLEPDSRTVLQAFIKRIRRWFAASTMPIDQLVMTVGRDLYVGARLETVRKLATTLRSWSDQAVNWRLPELTRELDEAIKTNRLTLDDDSVLFEPRPGVITLTTMHRAKGLEWDFVFLVDVDQERFHYHNEEKYFKGENRMIGGNPQAVVKAGLKALLKGENSRAEDATEQARIETISEDFRLLYVGITRARRYLCLSWGLEAEGWGRTRTVDPAMAFTRLQKHIRKR